MTRESAKKNLDIIKAFAEGKNIQTLEVDGTTWSDIEEPFFSATGNYRIKPSPKYVPWTKDNCPLECGDVLINVDGIKIKAMVTGIYLSEGNNGQPVEICGSWISFDKLFEYWKYEDGTPCGMKVEE